MKIFLIPIAAMALSACVTTTGPETDGRIVRLGEAAYVNGPRIRPVEVLEDSRCPTDAKCVWAGRVRLKMLWVKPSGDQEFELISGESKPLADGAITLTSVTPGKVTEKQILPTEYRFSFDFQGGI